MQHIISIQRHSLICYKIVNISKLDETIMFKIEPFMHKKDWQLHLILDAELTFY